jgi:hypothetical protein
LILNERYMRQTRVAEPRPQLEAVLKCLLVVVLLGRVFDYNCVVTFANFASLLGLGLPFLGDLDKLRRRRRLGDELLQVILQAPQCVSSTTSTK